MEKTIFHPGFVYLTHPTLQPSGFWTGLGHLDCFTLIGARLSTAHLANGDHLTILTDWDGAFQFRAWNHNNLRKGRGYVGLIVTDIF